MNVPRCQTMKGMCMFRISTNKCYNERFKSIEQILNVIFKYKLKMKTRLLEHFQDDIFSFGVPKPY